MLPCLVCGVVLDNAYGGSVNQPSQGTEFATFGHYGSTFWDSFAGEELVLNVCDECLTKHSDRLGRRKRYVVLVARDVRGDCPIPTQVGRQWVSREMVPWFDGPEDEDQIEIEPEEIGVLSIGHRCPRCVFSFARLVDAGDFHAYVCPDCEWQRPTSDRRPGNRPADVCALCDRPIDLTERDHHLYLGSGWVHGGGREHIPVHMTCLGAGRRAQVTDTIWTEDCSCPSAWQQVTGDHLIGCSRRAAS